MTPLQINQLREELLELVNTTMTAQLKFALVADERGYALPDLPSVSAFVQLEEDDDAARPVIVLTVAIAYAAYQDLPALRAAKRRGMRPLGKTKASLSPTPPDT